jgi:hypothetical protein
MEWTDKRKFHNCFTIFQTKDHRKPKVLL